MESAPSLLASCLPQPGQVRRLPPCKRCIPLPWLGIPSHTGCLLAMAFSSAPAAMAIVGLSGQLGLLPGSSVHTPVGVEHGVYFLVHSHKGIGCGCII